MFLVTEKKIEKDILTVSATIPLRKIASRQKIKIKSFHIIEKLSDEYTILETIKDDVICNSSHGGHKQTGEWIFKIRKSTASTRSSGTKKTSTKRSIRGRMSKLAKEKLSKEEK